MKQEDAERLTAEYLKAIYGFALKRCADLQDAEDLSQDIAYKVFRALLAKDDIRSPEKFIWTAAHNALANYYRGKSKSPSGVPIYGLAEILPASYDMAQKTIDKETFGRLHKEIAYLSKLQRRIVIAYYFENKKQATIAAELGIPSGTVKWHLFEAKKELKRGMDTMRQASELKFNPIRFALCGTNGSTGTKGANSNFFLSALSQNIVYDVWKSSKTINEIADDLGVSPVYVESEAEYLAEYGFLLEDKGKYICNILIEQPDELLNTLQNEMYGKAAAIFANELFDELTQSGILKDERIICHQSDKPPELSQSKKADDNFILWALIPYIAALSGEKLMDRSVSFEEAATVRPDGGHNICYASVLTPNADTPVYFDSMKHWCGPFWNRNKNYILWQIDSEWSRQRVDDSYIGKTERILDLFAKMDDGELTKEEYSFLTQNGIIKTAGDPSGLFKAALQIVWLKNNEIREKLIGIGDRIKEKHWGSFRKLSSPFIRAVLNRTPKHLHKMQKYGLQYIFFSDGWFILHCLKEPVKNGKLRTPSEEQKKSLTTIIATEKQ